MKVLVVEGSGMNLGDQIESVYSLLDDNHKLYKSHQYPGGL